MKIVYTEKRIKAMKAIQKTVFGLILLGALLSCDNPFKVGLGTQVDLKDPIITLEKPTAGLFIRGTEPFSGTALDDIKVDSVWIKLEDLDYVQVDSLDGSGLWTHGVNTSDFADGDIRVRLKAIDSVGKITETEEYVFTIKNALPSIELSVPPVLVGEEPGQLGSTRLNIKTSLIIGTGPDQKVYQRRDQEVGANNKLGGTARDLKGLAKGYPQIKMWPVVDENTPAGDLQPGDIIYTNYNIPSDTDFAWRPLEFDAGDLDSDGKTKSGLNKVQFSLPYTVYEQVGGNWVDTEKPLPTLMWYRFQILVKDVDGNEFVYPRDAYTTPEAQNSYIEVYMNPPGEYPLVVPYYDHLAPTAGITFIETQSADVRGNFTIAVKASHSQGISALRSKLEMREEGQEAWGNVLPSPTAELQPKVNPDDADEWLFTWKYTGSPALSAGDGTYEFRFTATAITSSTNSYTFKIRYDNTPSLIEITDMNSATDFSLTTPVETAGRITTHTNETGTKKSYVNGVIKPSVRITDQVSRLRSAAAVPGYGTQEAKWLVVDAANAAILDTKINDILYYPEDTGYFDAADLALSPYPFDKIRDSALQYTAGTHGFDSILAAPFNANAPVKIDTTAILSDNTTYYLYFFARDNAMNVRVYKEVLFVKQDSDKPRLDFEDSTIKNTVSNPNLTAGAGSFEDLPVANKKLSRTGTIKFNLYDDDGLDLGTTTKDSSLKIFITGTMTNTAGTIVKTTDTTGKNDPLWRKQLTDAQVKQLFGSSGTGNDYTQLRSRTNGEIKQDALMAALHNTPGGAALGGAYDYFPGNSQTNLPDGIYFLEIEVLDLMDFKEQNQAANIASQTTTTGFYFAVDNTLPDVSILNRAENSYAPSKGSVDLTGIMSDANVPLLKSNMRLDVEYREMSNTPGVVNPWLTTVPAAVGGPGIKLRPNSFELRTPRLATMALDGYDGYVFDELSGTADVPVKDGDVYKYGWRCYADIDSASDFSTWNGDIRFTVTTVDRFGNENATVRVLSIDTAPPSVGVRYFNKFLTRADPVLVSNYVNGWFEFTVEINDNYSVDWVHYFILPAVDTPPTYIDPSGAADPIAAAAAEQMIADALSAYPANIEKRNAGRFNLDSRPFSIKVDSAFFSDGKYNIYVIAKDAAGNYSSNGTSNPNLLWPIEIKQDTDQPNFEQFNNISPEQGAVIGLDNLILQGTIVDDDGFNITGADGNQTVKLRLQKVADNTTPVTVPDWEAYIPTAYLQCSSPFDKLIINKYNIGAISAIKSALGTYEGPIALEITVQDWYGNGLKFPEETLLTTRKSTIKTYWYELDQNDPVLDITSPVANASYGAGSATSFHLAGTVTDSYLQWEKVDISATPWTPSDTGQLRYFITYMVEGGAEKKIYLTSTPTASGPNTDGPMAWALESGAGEDLALFNSLSEGEQTISILAKDRSGKTANKTITVRIDNEPPVISLGSIAPLDYSTVTLTLSSPVDGTVNHPWYPAKYSDTSIWTPANKQLLFAAREKYLRDHNAPLIKHFGEAPEIKGSFDDLVSDIDVTTGKNKFRVWKEDGAAFDASANWISFAAANLLGSGKSRNWTISEPSRPDGVYSISLFTTDVAGNDSAAITLAHPARDDTRHFVFRLDHQAPTAAMSDNTEMTIPGRNKFGPSAGINDGDVFIAGTAQDANLQTVFLSLYKIDTVTGNSVPAVGFSDPVDIAKGIAGDTTEPHAAEVSGTSGLDGWEYNQTVGGATNISVLNWRFNMSSNSYAALTAGEYEFRIEAVDYAESKSEILRWQFTKDETAPDITVNLPQKETVNTLDANDYNTLAKIKAALNSGTITTIKGDTPKISGTVSDAATPINAMTFRLEKWDYNANTNAGEWKNKNLSGATAGWETLALSGTGSSQNWNWLLDPTLDEGFYRLTLRAEDSTWSNTDNLIGAGHRGNMKASNYVYFFWDKTGPDLSVETDSSKTDYLKHYYSGLANADHTATFTGTVIDINRIDRITLKLAEYPTTTTIYLNPAQASPAGAGSLTLDPDQSTNPGKYTWTAKLKLDDADNLVGDVTLQITAYDNAGNSRLISKPFTLDNRNPTAKVDAPVMVDSKPFSRNEKMIGPYTIRGTAADSDSGMENIQYYVGVNPLVTRPKPAATQAAINTEGKKVPSSEWRIPGGGTGPTAGTWGVNSYTDDDGKTQSTPRPNLVEFGTGINDWTLTIQDVAILARPFTTTSGEKWNDVLSNKMVYTVPIASTPNEDNPDEIGAGQSGIYALPLWLKITDRAGNVSYMYKELWLNPSGDTPYIDNVKFQGNVPNNTTIYGGAINVSGDAADNLWISDVVFRVLVKKDGSGTTWDEAVFMDEYSDKHALWVDALVSAKLSASSVWSTNYPDLNQYSAADGSRGWMRSPIMSPGEMVNFIFNVNGNKEIENLISGTQARVKVQILAFDAEDVGGSARLISKPVEYMGYIKTGAPTLSAKIRYTKADGSVDTVDYSASNPPTVRGTYSIITKAETTLGTSGKIDNMKYHGEESSSWSNLTPASAPGDWVISPTTANAGTYTITTPINTKTVNAGNFDNKAGTYRWYFHAEDSGSNPNAVAEYSVNVRIDNYYPMRDPRVTPPRKAVGSDYWVVGKALDGENASNPSVRGLQKVTAWITKGANKPDNYVNLETGEINTGYSGTPNTVSDARTGRDAAYTGDTITGVIPGTTASVDYPNPSANVDQWRREITNSVENQQFWTGSNWSREWGFKLDTTKLADGAITLHYIIFDEAGNASYYTESLVVMNKPPVIHEITLETDPRHQGGSLSSGGSPEERSIAMRTNFADSGFIVRNDYLKVSVEVNPAPAGTRPLYYTLDYVDRTPISAKDMTNGYVYTVKEAGDLKWDDYGAAAQTAPAGTHFIAAFTAAPPAGTTAEVWEYTSKARKYPSETLLVTAPSREHKIFSAATLPAFDRAYSTPDILNFTFQGSEITQTADSTAFFLLRISDSVRNDELGNANEQLNAIELIGLTIKGPDGTAPTARLYDISPYTEEQVVGNNTTATEKADTIMEAAHPQAIGSNEGRGGLYNTGPSVDKMVKSGHVEPRAGSSVIWRNITGTTDTATAFTRDQLSGTVILRGIATDDNQIKTISLTIDGETINILEADTTDSGELKAVNSAKAWAADISNWHDGHTVEWSYVWDTEKTLAGGAKTMTTKANVPITVTVVDFAGNSTTASAVNVDLVPYLQSFRRDAKFGTSRSLRSQQGRYTFGRGETVTAIGFNLKDAGATGMALWVDNVGGTGSVTLETTGLPQNNNEVQFNVPSDAKSGKIMLTTSNTDTTVNKAVNHHANHDTAKSWNRENYARGSDLWDDIPFAHIWVTDNDGGTTSNRTYFEGSDGGYYPAMTINARDGVLHGAWADLSAANVSKGRSDTSASSFNNGGAEDPYTDVDIFFNTYNSGTASNDNYSMVFQYGRDYSAQRGSVFVANRTNSMRTGNPLLRPPNNGERGRYFWNMRIASRSNGTGNDNTVFYTSAYASGTRNLRYAQGTGNDRNTTEYTGLIIDGNSALSNVANNNSFGTIGGAAVAGEYSAIGLRTNNYPVIAYWDKTNDTVRLAYANSDSPTSSNGSNWTRRYVIPSGDIYEKGSGQYISMKIDPRNNDIHLAFFNSLKNTLVYAKGTYDGEFTTVAVDNAVIGGRYTGISLDSSGNPVITYVDGVGGTYGRAKIAYLDTAAFTKLSKDPFSNAKVNTGWEAMNVPLGYAAAMNDERGRLSVEAWPPRTPNATMSYTPPSLGWNAAVGYYSAGAGTSDRFRIAYFIKPGF
ncbi:hypothetical protein AGMMS50293_06370 [Spirochaetia bacterium]|nr:hypothetical protein AGMMS50293_06370 [Spirochaetia bacterium]